MTTPEAPPPTESTASPSPAPTPTSPPFSYETSKDLYLFTSLTAGSSHIITNTRRMQTILQANAVSFTAIDIATDEKAKRIWVRRSGGRKLPGLVKDGLVKGGLEELEDWNEFGEVREALGVPLPVRKPASRARAGLDGTSGGSAKALDKKAGDVAGATSAKEVDIPDRTKDEATTADTTTDTPTPPPSQEQTQQSRAAALASEAAAAAASRSKKTTSPSLKLTQTPIAPTFNKDEISASNPEALSSEATPSDTKTDETTTKEETTTDPDKLQPLTLTPEEAKRKASLKENILPDGAKSPSEANHPPAPPPTASLAGAVEAARRTEDSDDEEPVMVEREDADEAADASVKDQTGELTAEDLASKEAGIAARGSIAVRVDVDVLAEQVVEEDGKAVDTEAVGAAPAASSGVEAVTKEAVGKSENDDEEKAGSKAEAAMKEVDEPIPAAKETTSHEKDMGEQKKAGDEAKGEAKEEEKAADSVED